MDYKNMTKSQMLERLQHIENSRGEPEWTKDLPSVMEELRIHQVELEMQNRELKETHAQLENALDRYQSLFDFAPVSYLTLDAKGMIVETNLAAQELLGLEKSAYIGKPFTAFVAPGYVRVFLAHLRHSLEAREQMITELPLAVRGQQIVLQIFSLAHSLPHDHRIFCRCAMIDVTERRKIERQLQESEERYQRLFYPVSDAVLLVDQAGGTIIDNNASAITLYGYTSVQLTGMKLSTLFVDQEKCQVMLRHQARRSEVLYQRKQDGSTFPADVSAYSFIHRGLVVVGLTVHDLTRQKLLEEARRREEEQFRTAIRCAPGFLAVYDGTGRYRFVNASAEEWLQRSGDQLLGKRDEEAVAEEVRREYLPLLLKVLETKTVQTSSCTFRAGNGRFEATMTLTPLTDPAGEVTQVIATGISKAGSKADKS